MGSNETDASVCCWCRWPISREGLAPDEPAVCCDRPQCVAREREFQDELAALNLSDVEPPLPDPEPRSETEKDCFG